MRNHLGATGGAGLLLYFNLDTISLWYPPGRWSTQTVAELEAKKSLAQESEQIFGRGAYVWEVLAHGASGFTYILRGASSTITIQRGGGALVVVRAALLAEMGPDACVEEMTAIVGGMRERARSGATESPRARVSRVDICADLETEVFGRDHLERMVTRARSRTVYGFACASSRCDTVTAQEVEAAQRALSRIGPGMEKDEVVRRVAQAMHLGRVWRTQEGDTAVEHRAESTFMRGRRTTGITLGKGDLMLRIYDKIQEENQTKKGWVKPLWREAGWRDTYLAEGSRGGAPVSLELAARTPSEATAAARRAGICAPRVRHARPVTRFEFQLRKAALDGFDEVRRAGRDYEAVRAHLPGVWSYLVGQWATLRVRGNSAQPTRWPIDPVWRALQRISFGTATSIRRASLGSPPAWVEKAVAEERAGVRAGGHSWLGPIGPTEQRQDPDRTAVRAVARRMGLHASRGRATKGDLEMFGAVLDNAEAAKLERLAEQARGVVTAMAAIIGGGEPIERAVAMVRRIEGVEEKVKRAEARLVYRGAQELRL